MDTYKLQILVYIVCYKGVRQENLPNSSTYSLKITVLTPHSILESFFFKYKNIFLISLIAVRIFDILSYLHFLLLTYL